jgi:hypothetical protein
LRFEFPSLHGGGEALQLQILEGLRRLQVRADSNGLHPFQFADTFSEIGSAECLIGDFQQVTSRLGKPRQREPARSAGAMLSPRSISQPSHAAANRISAQFGGGTA